MRPSTSATGKWAEEAVLQYLITQGHALLTRNFARKFGELDLVMLDGQVLVFVEVRYRRSAAYGGALASVNRPKQRKIIAAAQAYLVSHPRLRYRDCRFDVVAVSRPNYAPVFHWIRDAFSADS